MSEFDQLNISKHEYRFSRIMGIIMARHINLILFVSKKQHWNHTKIVLKRIWK